MSALTALPNPARKAEASPFCAVTETASPCHQSHPQSSRGGNTFPLRRQRESPPWIFQPAALLVGTHSSWLGAGLMMIFFFNNSAYFIYFYCLLSLLNSKIMKHVCSLHSNCLVSLKSKLKQLVLPNITWSKRAVYPHEILTPTGFHWTFCIWIASVSCPLLQIKLSHYHIWSQEAQIQHGSSEPLVWWGST